MRKARILYVDDEIGAAKLLKNNLEQTGRYEVCLQNWPQDALESAREFKPDLMLLDIIMPNLPGGNVIEIFEADPEFANLPIVFFTAAVWKHQVEENEGEICDHPCLAKPASLKEIMEIIEANLPENCREEPSQAPQAQEIVAKAFDLP